MDERRLPLPLPVLLSALLLAICGCGDGSATSRLAPEADDGSSLHARVPEGFAVELFAKGRTGVRFLALDPRGRLTASVPNEDSIYLVLDEDGDTRAEQWKLFHEGIRSVHGLAWHEGALYAAGTGALWRLRDTDGDLVADEETLLTDAIPAGGGHWTRTVVVGPGPGGEPHLYLSIGSTCNVCVEEHPWRAAVVRLKMDGSQPEVFATGLRNSVGMAFRPGTAELWATDNGRDRLGDDTPPDELNLLREGRFYGWPYYYGDSVRDPRWENVPEGLRAPEPMALGFQAHSAPLGLCFYDGTMFPSAYRGDAFVAFHGSWNRSVPTGYKLVRVRFEDGEPTSYEDFMDGLLELEPTVRKHGRPVDCVVAPDGALLVSDDGAGRIYRISREAPGN